VSEEKYYLLELEGLGDHEYKVIDKESWDWLKNPDPKSPPPQVCNR
jgi:hypothetical protein